MDEKRMIYSEELIDAVIQTSKKGSADIEYLRYLNSKREKEREEKVEQEEKKDRGLFSKLFKNKKINPFIKKIGKILIFVGSYILKGILIAIGIDLFRSLFELCEGNPSGVDIIYF